MIDGKRAREQFKSKICFFLLPLDSPYQEAWLFPLLEVEFTGQEHLAPGSLLEIQPMEGHPKPTHQF